MTFNSLRWPHSRLNGANHQRVRHFTLVYRHHHSQTTPSPPPSRALGTIICGSLIPPPALPCTLDSPAASAASHDSHLADSAESPVNSPASPLSSIAVRSPVEDDKPHHDVGVDISGRHLFRRAVRKIHSFDRTAGREIVAFSLKTRESSTGPSVFLSGSTDWSWRILLVCECLCDWRRMAIDRYLSGGRTFERQAY